MRSLDRPYECLRCFWRYSSPQALRDHKKKYRKTCGSKISNIQDHMREVIFCESLLPPGAQVAMSEDDSVPYIVDDLIRRNRRLCPFDDFFHCRYVHTSPQNLEYHIKNWHPEKYSEVILVPTSLRSGTISMLLKIHSSLYNFFSLCDA